MTLLAVWYQEDTLFLAADTRLSMPGTSNGILRLTDHGVKLIPFSMSCYGPATNGFFTELRLTRQFVLGYAGSSLVAQQTSLAMSVLLGNLVSNADSNFPSVQDIANLAARLVQEYTTEVAQMYSDAQKAATDCIIAGMCPQKNVVRVFKLVTKINENSQPPIQTTAEEICSLKDLETPYLLGDTKAKSELQSSLSGASSSTPLKALETMVHENTTADTVGGGVQFGWILGGNYQPVSLCRGNPATFLNLGFDLTDLAPTSTLNGWITGGPGYAG